MMPHTQRLIIALLSLAFLTIAFSKADAGVDVSVEQQLRRLEILEDELRRHPAHEEILRLKGEIEILRDQLHELAGDPEAKQRAAEIGKRINTLERRLSGAIKEIRSFELEERRKAREELFPKAQHRVAVFTFDDPDNTGIGDALSFLISKKILFSTSVRSFAVVNFQQGASAKTESGLAYFDKVDKLTAGEDFRISLWGRISANGPDAVIDTFAQMPSLPGTRLLRDLATGPRDRLPPQALSAIFSAQSIRLPEAMGAGILRARLKPSRFKIQSFRIDREEIERFKDAARQVRSLRQSPNISGSVVTTLKEDQSYFISDSRGAWVQLTLSDGTIGWTSVSKFCSGVCKQLLDTAFLANDLVAISSGRQSRLQSQSVSQQARAVASQLEALVMLKKSPQKAIGIAEGWTSPRKDATKKNTAPAAGASFINIIALAKIALALEKSRDQGMAFDLIRLDRVLVTEIAAELAKASVSDPNDLDALYNLAVLFGYLEDFERRDLALQIAKSVEVRLVDAMVAIDPKRRSLFAQ